MSEQSRKAFEAWMASEGRGDGFDRLVADEPMFGLMAGADWEAWQASRAATLEEAAKVCDQSVDVHWYGEGAIAAMTLAEAIRSLAEKTGKD